MGHADDSQCEIQWHQTIKHDQSAHPAPGEVIIGHLSRLLAVRAALLQPCVIECTRLLKEPRLFRPYSFSIRQPFQMANMPGSPPGSPDYAAMMEQVSIVPEFRLVSCQQCIWSALVTPLVCQMINKMGSDGEY